MQSKPRGKVLLQIVVPDDREQAVLAGLSGLLRTAARENPQIVGQVMLTSAEMPTTELGLRLKEEHRSGSTQLSATSKVCARYWRGKR